MISCAPDVISDEWYEAFNTFLDNFPNLEKISLKGMKIGENFVFFSDHLKRMKSVDLQMNGISPAIALNLMSVLELPKLEELNLGANWIGYQGLRAMKDGLSQMKNLKTL